MKALIIFLSVIMAGAIMIFAINTSRGNANKLDINENNVSIVDGKQIITIRARGGYQPQESVAKAGIPTIVRFVTSTTFDCSAFVRFPSLNILKNLPPTGTTDIEIGSQDAKTLLGSCGMGMYPFQIDFKS